MIRIENVSKIYRQGKQYVYALRGVSLHIPKGSFVSIMGPSGSGKSTLLNLMGALDTPTEGEIWLEDRSIQQMSDDELTLFRRRRLGLIFQFFNLLPLLTAEENAVLPLLLEGKTFEEVRSRGEEILALVGLSHRLHHKPDELSGGEMQRVAIARSLITNPPILLADEPTGNLDSQTGEEILKLLRKLCKDFKYTIVMVTHDNRAAAYGDRIVKLRDGKITSEMEVKENDAKPIAIH